ncbi:MAG: hypothetical protein KF716_03930 [Anaerolineae bacterium]|nr:hypothetical protein [Anaerolineae bacterium]
MRARRWITTFNRSVILLLLCSFPPAGIDPRVTAVLALLPASNCAQLQPVDPRGTLTDIQHAHDLNALIADARRRAIDHAYFTDEQVLTRIDADLPLIGCLARAARLPPELLASVLALELDLDYHLTDAVGDQLILSPLGEGFANIDVGAGYAQVHIKRLKTAIIALNPNLPPSPFLRAYADLITDASAVDLTLFATRYRALDVANAALMLRYYTALRMGSQTQRLSLDDMAIIWSAYRGGVIGTPVDPDSNHRWALVNYQHVNDPMLMGDTLIAMPYLRYFSLRFNSINP